MMVNEIIKFIVLLSLTLSTATIIIWFATKWVIPLLILIISGYTIYMLILLAGD